MCLLRSVAQHRASPRCPRCSGCPVCVVREAFLLVGRYGGVSGVIGSYAPVLVGSIPTGQRSSDGSEWVGQHRKTAAIRFGWRKHWRKRFKNETRRLAGLQFDLRMERRTRFELATFCLEGRSSTTELPPHLPVQIKFKLTSSIPFLPVRAMEGRLSRADNISALTTLC